MDPLAQLKDIQLPQEVSQWPPAYGWWLLAAVAIFVMVATVMWLLHRSKQRKAMKLGLIAIAQINLDKEDWLQQLNMKMKQVSLAYFTPETVAKLYGKQWQTFLKALVKPAKISQVKELLETTGNQHYQPEAAVDKELLINQSKYFLKAAFPPNRKTRRLVESNSGEVSHD